MEIFLGSHHFLLIMKRTPPPLVFPASAVLSIRKTEKLSDGVAAVSGTEVVSHVSVKQRMLQGAGNNAKDFFYWPGHGSNFYLPCQHFHWP